MVGSLKYMLIFCKNIYIMKRLFFHYLNTLPFTFAYRTADIYLCERERRDTSYSVHKSEWHSLIKLSGWGGGGLKHTNTFNCDFPKKKFKKGEYSTYYKHRTLTLKYVFIFILRISCQILKCSWHEKWLKYKMAF